MSDTHALTPNQADIPPDTGVGVETVFRLNKYVFTTESRSRSISFDENDELEVPVNDLMETENKYRTLGPGAFKTHEQMKQELFGD